MYDRAIALHARLRPQAPAFNSLDGTASYAAFDADIDRVAGALAEHAGCRPGALAAVEVANPYLHWLTLLALARLGVASCPAVPEIPATLLLSDRPDGGCDVLLSADWTRGVLTAPRPAVPFHSVDPATLGRVMPSSGTTGTRKRIGSSWERVDDLAKNGLMLNANTVLRLMVLTGPDTTMGFSNPLSAWYGGGTVLGTPGLAALPDAMPRLAPTVMIMGTGQLAALLSQLPAGFVSPPGLRVAVAGSQVYPALARRAKSALNCELYVYYGSTEVSGVAVMPAGVTESVPDAVGYIVPLKVVEVVDQAGQPVALGVEGEIRVRGDLVVTEYMDDPAASGRAFRDGWFYPGDIGRLEADRLLRVSGRVDDVMNVNGVKFLPAALESPAYACPGVMEAATFLVARDTGEVTVHLAVVRGTDFEAAALAQAMRDAVTGVLPRLVWVDLIPKNAMGKPDRARLANAMVTRAATQGS